MSKRIWICSSLAGHANREHGLRRHRHERSSTRRVLRKSEGANIRMPEDGRLRTAVYGAAAVRVPFPRLASRPCPSRANCSDDARHCGRQEPVISLALLYTILWVCSHLCFVSLSTMNLFASVRYKWYLQIWVRPKRISWASWNISPRAQISTTIFHLLVRPCIDGQKNRIYALKCFILTCYA